MNLIPNLKKKQTGHVATAAITPTPIPATATASLLGDLTPLAQLVQPMRARMKEFDHALHALSVARERQRDLDDVSPPSMALAIQREIVVAMGDTQELARFDARTRKHCRPNVMHARQWFVTVKNFPHEFWHWKKSCDALPKR